ncbi:hypothetical protein GCM10007290_06490 [Providencia stuartii]|nr:hypothetical protein [Providencia stuartii]GHB84602.1 hypothetical protein GCM10007290_06490 [Providencia thailandensis]
MCHRVTLARLSSLHVQLDDSALNEHTFSLLALMFHPLYFSPPYAQTHTYDGSQSNCEEPCTQYRLTRRQWL